MNISYNGFNAKTLTITCDESVAEGMAVTIREDGSVYPCGEDDSFCGYAVNVRGGYAGVQFSGFVKMKSAGEIAPGMKKLGVDAEGNITEKDTGRECIVIINYPDGTVGFIL